MGLEQQSINFKQRISRLQKFIQYFALASLLSARSFRTLASMTIIDMDWIDGWQIIDPPKLSGRQVHQARAEMRKRLHIYQTTLQCMQRKAGGQPPWVVLCSLIGGLGFARILESWSMVKFLFGTSTYNRWSVKHAATVIMSSIT